MDAVESSDAKTILPVKIAVAKNIVETLQNDSQGKSVLFGNNGLVVYQGGRSPVFYFHLEPGITDSFASYHGNLIQTLPRSNLPVNNEEIERALLDYHLHHESAKSFLLTSRGQTPQLYHVLDFGTKFVAPNNYDIADASEIPQSHLDDIFREHKNWVSS